MTSTGPPRCWHSPLKTMSEHQVRRLPVIDGHDLVGMLAMADVARNLGKSDVGDVVQDISQP